MLEFVYADFQQVDAAIRYAVVLSTVSSGMLRRIYITCGYFLRLK